MGPLQILVLCTAVLTLCSATPPPGYVKKPDNDKDPPKYEFGYDVRDGKGGRQGHLESRDGIYALGLYYVNLPDGSGQSVRYFADDWGYHPLVSYTSSTKTGSSRTHFALGEKAVAALAKSKDDNPSISLTGPATSVTIPVLKLPASVGDGGSHDGDILKIRPGKVGVPSNNVGGRGRKPASSYQQLSRPSGEHVDVSAVNNLVDTNGDNSGGSGDVKYEPVTPNYSTSQLVSDSGSVSSPVESYKPQEPSNYETGQEYQQVGAEGTGSSSYQLIEIGSDSSGVNNGDSGSQAPVFLPLVSESGNTESGKSLSGYSNGNRLKVSSYVPNTNGALQFGDRIRNVGAGSIQPIPNIEQEQNEINREHTITTPASSPQRYSPLRPIIVAEIVPKEEEEEVDKETTGTLRSIIVSPTTTPPTVHISHSPKSSSSISFISSGDTKSGSVASNNNVVLGEYSTSTNPLSSQSQGASYSYTSGSDDSSRNLGSVNNGGFSGHIFPQEYSTPEPILVSYSKATGASSYSSSGSDGSSSGSSISVDEGNVAHAAPLVYTTPAPVLVSYSQDASYSSGAEGGSSQSVVATNNGNTGHVLDTHLTPAPVFVLYSHAPTSSYSHSSISGADTIGGTGNGYLSSVIYPTPGPVLPISQPQESSPFSSSASEENSQQQSITTVNNGNTGQIIDSQHSTPTSVYISHSPKSSSFAISKTENSQSSNSVTTLNKGNSGQISSSSVHPTTPHPIIVSTYSSEDVKSSGGYIVGSTPAPVLLNQNPLPVAAALTSSAEVLAPIQAAVSLGSGSYQQSVAEQGASAVTSQPPQVTEEVDDIPQPKTVVEVQKAISLDLNSVSVKSEQKPDQGPPTPAAPTSYNQQAVESGKQVEQSGGQQQINTANFIEYGYSQPLIGLQVQHQIGYSPQLIESGQQVLYGYNPQSFEAQKLTHFRYNTQQQLYDGAQQQTLYEQNQQSFEAGKQQQENVQKQVAGQLQTISEYKHQQVTEAGKTGSNYQYNEQLTVEGENNPQHQLDVQKQQVTTAYNQQLASGGHQVLSQQLPEVTQVQAGYSQQLVQTESQEQKYPTQINQEVRYQQPLQISQQVEYQVPIAINQEIEYQVPVQQVGYQGPIEIKQPAEYLTPININQHVQQNTHNADVQSGFSQHIIHSSGYNQQTSQTNSQSSGQSSQGQPAYNKSPGEVTKQIQTEYNHQLEEEDKQEQVRFSNQIGDAFKQTHTDYSEEVGKHVSLQTSNEDKPLIAVNYPSIPVQSPVNVIPSHAIKLVEVEKPVHIEHTKLIEVEKPIPIHHTKVVEKPIPIPLAVPVEITKLVAVDRPVPYPQPFAVPHPVPVPYAVPHPIGVPVPHLVPYPHVVTVPFKELHPVYIRNGKPYKHDSATYHYQVQNFPSHTPLPVILKALQYHGGRYGVPVSMKTHYFHSSRIPQNVYLSPPPLKPSGRGRGLQHSKYLDHLRTLCIEYGFKPPLVPSLQIEEVPASVYGPPKKD